MTPERGARPVAAAVGLIVSVLLVLAAGAALGRHLREPRECVDTVCATPIPGARVTYLNAPTVTAVTQAEIGLARVTLKRLRIADDTHPPGYDRDPRFGSWRSIGHGCDVRDLVLARDLRDDVLAPGSPCEVVAGTLRGIPVRATQLDIDHVYPDKLAWDTGAAGWSDARRRAFSNDQLNLRAEPLGANRSNGDLGPEASPPGGDECAWTVAFTFIADHYDLSVPAARRDALARLLERCPT